MKEIVTFKSTPENWQKERDGRKPNTLREKDLSDRRHLVLGAMMVSGDYGEIEIVNTETEKSFFRTITDVTEWKGWLIISWRHRREKK